MRTRRRTGILAAMVLVLLAAGALALPLFLPEQATHVDDDISTLAAPDTIHTVKRGTWSGADSAHKVAGTIEIITTNGTPYLSFIDYQQTQGPDVYIFLTESTRFDKAHIESGLRVSIDGGADGGESTKTGTFQQRLPDHFDPQTYQGVAAWCDRFDQLFGSAVLDPA